jgi:hypothetical protein
MLMRHAGVRMPKREWIEAYVAVEQLMTCWDVPITMAENTKSLLQSNPTNELSSG